MPHTRNRHIENLLNLALKSNPIVGILGQRQTGKTTLLSALSNEYSTLDKIENLRLANSEPEAFLLQRRAPFAIDECQLAPALFPALKEHVRITPARGQFLLSGSVRFTSRKAIQESLTGRILTFELLPFSLSEMHGHPLLDPTDEHRLQKKSEFTPQDLERFTKRGGMPGISFKRNEKLTGRFWEDHINTLIDRDLRLIVQTSLRFASLRQLITLLAENVARPLDYSDLSRRTRISRLTLRKLISAFESMFLIRILPCEGGISTPRLFFEDVGMVSYLRGQQLDPSYLLTQGFYQCARAWFFYSKDSRFEFFQFLTKGGAFVPLAVRSENRTTGWILSTENRINQSMLDSARSFCGHYGPKAKVLIVGPALPYQKIESQIYAGAVSNLL